jgi:hypothetical protein
VKTSLRIGWIFLCLALALAARCWNLRDVFIEGHIYFVDADCYSRMTRVRLVAEHPGTIIRHHDFENWPQGIVPHTTAPLDYLILGLKCVLDAGFAAFDPGGTSVLRGQTLDLAGALISPLLGLAGGLFLALWLWRSQMRFWEMALLLYAISPILVHGTVLGRPDHQALLIVLLMVALGAELALARGAVDERSENPNSCHPERSAGGNAGGAEPKDLSHPAGEGGGESGCDAPAASAHEKSEVLRLRSAHVAAYAPLRMTSWGCAAGVAWALSLWVSLYEPLILFSAVIGLWLALDRRALFARVRRPGWIAFAAILVAAFLLEGWRIQTPDAAMRAYFGNWKASIGELAHLDLLSPVLYQWLGWMVLAAPVLLIVARKAERRALPMLGLLACTLALTVWQIRWGYFLAVVFVLALPLFTPVLRRWWIAWPLFLAALWPVAEDWDARLFPDEIAQRDYAVKRAEVVALRSIVSVKTGANGGPFLAPWWLSPPIAYWTGQPGVAGSSHESLPGTVDAARVYLAHDAETALPILRARRVAWILSDAPERVIPTSAALLGVPAPEKCLAHELARHFHEEPWSSSIIPEKGVPRPLGNDFFQVWRVRAETDAASVPVP